MGGGLDLLDLLLQAGLDEIEEGGVFLFFRVVRLLQIEIPLFGAPEGLLLEFVEIPDHPLVDGVRHEEDFEILFLQPLQVGAVQKRGQVVAGNVVDLLLVRLHPADVVRQGRVLPVRVGRLVAQQRRDLVLVVEVLGNPGLEDRAELPVEGLVFFRLHFRQEIQDLLDQVLLDVPDEGILLEDLAADVQIEVRGIDDALDEGQVPGHEFLAVLHDEDPLGVELNPVFLLLGEEIEGGLRGDVQKGAVFRRPFEFQVEVGQGGIPVMADVAVEFVVLLVGDLLLALGPDRLHGVEGLFPDHLLCLSLLRFAVLVENRLRPLHVHDDGIGDKIGMLLHDAAEGPLVGEILLVLFRLFQFQEDRRSPGRLLRRFDGVGAVPGGFPFRGACRCRRPG